MLLLSFWFYCILVRVLPSTLNINIEALSLTSASCSLECFKCSGRVGQSSCFPLRGLWPFHHFSFFCRFPDGPPLVPRLLRVSSVIRPFRISGESLNLPQSIVCLLGLCAFPLFLVGVLYICLHWRQHLSFAPDQLSELKFLPLSHLLLELSRLSPLTSNPTLSVLLQAHHVLLS